MLARKLPTKKDSEEKLGSAWQLVASTPYKDEREVLHAAAMEALQPRPFPKQSKRRLTLVEPKTWHVAHISLETPHCCVFPRLGTSTVYTTWSTSRRVVRIAPSLPTPMNFSFICPPEDPQSSPYIGVSFSSVVHMLLNEEHRTANWWLSPCPALSAQGAG